MVEDDGDSFVKMISGPFNLRLQILGWKVLSSDISLHVFKMNSSNKVTNKFSSHKRNNKRQTDGQQFLLLSHNNGWKCLHVSIKISTGVTLTVAGCLALMLAVMKIKPNKFLCFSWRSRCCYITSWIFLSVFVRHCQAEFTRKETIRYQKELAWKVVLE